MDSQVCEHYPVAAEPVRPVRFWPDHFLRKIIKFIIISGCGKLFITSPSVCITHTFVARTHTVNRRMIAIDEQLQHNHIAYE